VRFPSFCEESSRPCAALLVRIEWCDVSRWRLLVTVPRAAFQSHYLGGPTTPFGSGGPDGNITASGHSRPGRASSKSGHVRYAAESGSNSEHERDSDGALRVGGAARDVIQVPKPEPQIMRYELSDYEWSVIKPMLPNKPRGVPRVDERKPCCRALAAKLLLTRLESTLARRVADRDRIRRSNQGEPA